jgi:hypothetical protein
MRAFGIWVDDTPKQFDEWSQHAIIVPMEDLTIPFDMRGVISYFDSHKPTKYELENCRRVVLTLDKSWDPNNTNFEWQEQAARDHAEVAAVVLNGDGLEGVSKDGDEKFDAVLKNIIPDTLKLCNEVDFVDCMVALVNVLACDVGGGDLRGEGIGGCDDPDSLFDYGYKGRRVMVLSREKKENVVTKEVLAKRWGWTRCRLQDAQDDDFARHSIFRPSCQEEVSYFMASLGVSYDATLCVC